MTPPDRLARLHCVNTLLHALTGHDLYLAEQLLQAVEAAGGETNAGLDARLIQLHEELLGTAPEAGFAFCDGSVGASTAGPLFLHAELTNAIDRTAPKPRSTIMVGNLSSTAQVKKPRNGTRASRARAREYADLVEFLRDVAARRASPGSLLTLLFV